MKETKSKSNIIKVEFFVPVNGVKEYYFGSLAAIYEQFTSEQIGCRMEALWASGIEPGKPKATRHCVISKHGITRKSRVDKSGV